MNGKRTKVGLKGIKRCYLSIATLECTSSAKRFPSETFNEKKLLSTQQIQKDEQHFYMGV